MPWQYLLVEYANKKKIKLLFLNSSLLEPLNVLIIDQLKKYVWFYIHFRNIVKARRIYKKTITYKNNLNIRYKGSVNVLNNGYNSDFFWANNSDYPLSRIVYSYVNTYEKNILINNHIIASEQYIKY